ncbi:phosphodiester glycosidase family protein [Weissella minor]|nr:phosphodiester glycosidase family protein [Weissella minor]
MNNTEKSYTHKKTKYFILLFFISFGISLLLISMHEIQFFNTKSISEQNTSALDKPLDYDVNAIFADNGSRMWNTQIRNAKMGVGFSKDNLSPGKVDLETPSHFAKRHNLELVINASRFNVNAGQMWGTHMHDGKVIAHSKWDASSSYLTIGNDGKTLGSKPNATVFQNGQYQEVITGFFPLIQNGKPVPKPKNMKVASDHHPRQIIYQLDDGTLGILSVSGRFDGNKGLNYRGMVHELSKIKHVRFAYNLDGGGSTSTVVNGQMINPSFDESRSERPVRDYIYFYSDEVQDPLKTRPTTTLR